MGEWQPREYLARGKVARNTKLKYKKKNVNLSFVSSFCSEAKIIIMKKEQLIFYIIHNLGIKSCYELCVGIFDSGIILYR